MLAFFVSRQFLSAFWEYRSSCEAFSAAFAARAEGTQIHAPPDCSASAKPLTPPTVLFSTVFSLDVYANLSVSPFFFAQVFMISLQHLQGPRLPNTYMVSEPMMIRSPFL